MYLHHIPTPPLPIGLCLSDEFFYVITDEQKLVKIQISSKKIIKSVVTEKNVYGMDISSNIYVCEYYNKSVIVFDKNLNFLKRIPLKFPHVTSDTQIGNIIVSDCLGHQINYSPTQVNSSIPSPMIS